MGVGWLNRKNFKTLGTHIYYLLVKKTLDKKHFKMLQKNLRPKSEMLLELSGSSFFRDPLGSFLN